MIAVTGANGYIGSALVDRLHVVNSRVFPIGYIGNQRVARGDSVRCDLTDYRSLLAAMGDPAASGLDTVVHLAGAKAAGTTSEFYKHNVAATANVLDYCVYAGVRHLVYASSQAVYGIPCAWLLTEDTWCCPASHYARSKLCAEQLLHTGHTPELNITVLRFPGVFSESRTSGTVHTWCTQAVERGNVFVDASEPVPFDVIYLDDVVGAIHAAIRWGGDGYTILNVGTGMPCSLTMLADEIAALVPGCVVTHNECPQPTVRLSVAKAKEVLGWECRSRTDRLRGMIRSIVE